MREIVTEEKVTAHAESRGWLARKVIYAGRKGAPDRWYFKAAKLVIIEFKRRGGDLDGHQVREKARLEAAGFKVHVIDNIEDGLALFA